MAQITLKGNPVETFGELPEIGSTAPDFSLVKGDLSEVSLRSMTGGTVILNISPSLDTDLCAMTVRRFNVEAASRPDVKILCISADLPFAHSRFCETEGIENVTTLSVFRSPSFGEEYGVLMTTGPLRGLLSRAVVVVDPSGKVIHREQVPEIAQEPNYAAALAILP